MLSQLHRGKNVWSPKIIVVRKPPNSDDIPLPPFIPLAHQPNTVRPRFLIISKRVIRKGGFDILSHHSNKLNIPIVHF